ncbi:glycosyltransferase family 4 protein [Arthrobacter rhombi]|uniref:glycosyltransferase family 4 protein n=1 Tax=Arthrobacter rhombi TaxID=71253 RepID=UPI003FD32E88
MPSPTNFHELGEGVPTIRRRVLVQVNSLALGGTQLNAVDMAVAMRAYGYDSVLVGPLDTVPEGPSLFDVAETKGIRVEGFQRAKHTLNGAMELRRIVKKHRSEVVHIYGSWTARPALWGPCLLGRRPLVLTIYEMAVDTNTPVGPELVVGTGYLRDDLADRAGGVELISPPVDVCSDQMDAVDAAGFLRSQNLVPQNQRIVMVTRLDAEMKATGVAQAIDAMRSFAGSNVDLIIVGTGDVEEKLRQRAEDVNVDYGRRAIVFTGAMPDPRAAYAASDIVIGMGGSAARALSFGKPLVVTGEKGWFKTFEPETAEPLFRSSFWSDETVENPVAQLEACLSLLLSDQELCLRLGRFGREFAIERFSLDAMAERQAKVYDRSLNNYGLLRWCWDLGPEAVLLARAIQRGASRALQILMGRKDTTSVST